MAFESGDASKGSVGKDPWFSASAFDHEKGPIVVPDPQIDTTQHKLAPSEKLPVLESGSYYPDPFSRFLDRNRGIQRLLSSGFGPSIAP